MSVATVGELDVSADVHTEDSERFARTIHHGLSQRERRALAVVLVNMPCSVSSVARIAGVSRRTAQRACDALLGRGVALLQRAEAGLIIDPEAVGGVEAWADIYGPRSGVAEWWEDLEPAHDPGGRHDPDRGDWPDDVLPGRAPSADADLALRAVESRRAPLGRGTFIPFAVLDYVAVTRSLQAAKVTLECGRRASRAGVAEFGRGELARITGLSSQQVSDTLARMRREGIAMSATATQVELDLTHK
ncbi:hypothetical protein CIK73_06055 [Brachybacterium alimentarium]|uniref:hypothetical protein n=1 Tax=Brachybacterium alimentarium TaxID=47845 RepID=UPI000DF431EC|nr:hypothetical protein [Brachybacterium alimentarium]RCS69483.1 hypothetical protein CIK73_06055 [Brachybacterium alimentarium]